MRGGTGFERDTLRARRARESCEACLFHGNYNITRRPYIAQRPIYRARMRAYNGHVDGYAEFIKY